MKLTGTARPGILVTLCLSSLLGCSSGSTGNSTAGECTPRIEFNGVGFRDVSGVVDVAPAPTSPLGTADLQTCTHEGWETIDRVKVERIEGVDDSIAILVGGDYAGIYIDERSDISSLPESLRSKQVLGEG